jgi:hypothetical protein
MDLRKFLLGQNEFKSPNEIIEIVRESPSFDTAKEDTASAEALLIFQTSKQQTWLVATRAHLYCVLDDLKSSFTKVQWAMGAEELTYAGNITATISTRDNTKWTGLLDVEERRNWLFSKMLFTNKSCEDEIRGLVRRQMISP